MELKNMEWNALYRRMSDNNIGHRNWICRAYAHNQYGHESKVKSKNNRLIYTMFRLTINILHCAFLQLQFAHFITEFIEKFSIYLSNACNLSTSIIRNTRTHKNRNFLFIYNRPMVKLKFCTKQKYF